MVGFRIPQQHQGIGCFIVLVPAVGGERAAPSYVGRDPVTFDALAFMGGEVLRITLHQQPGLFRGPHVGQDLYLQHCRIGVVRLAREPCLHLLQGFGKSPVIAERGDCRPCAVGSRTQERWRWGMWCAPAEAATLRPYGRSIQMSWARHYRGQRDSDPGSVNAACPSRADLNARVSFPFRMPCGPDDCSRPFGTLT